MPLIKFTVTENTPNGSQKVIKFLNAAQLTETTWNEATGCLTLFFGDRPGGKGEQRQLSGDEAKQALAVLQSM